MARQSDPLDQLVDAVLARPKYRGVCADLVRNVGERELARRRTLKDAIKATLNKLHQVNRAYLGGEDYDRWLEQVSAAYASGSREEIHHVSTQVMSHHASTRERLPFLDQFYGATLAGLPPIRSILDIACGLNPLAIPWMPLAKNATYHAYDIDHNLIGFLNRFLLVTPVDGRAHLLDATQHCPGESADLALILKAIPCLEQIDKSAGRRLLDTINAKYLLVSFPAQSLGGRSKGMVATYRTKVGQLLAERDWPVEEFHFPTELVFRITREPSGLPHGHPA